MWTDKIVSRKQLLDEVKKRRRLKDKIVFTNGCFDILHIRHLKVLNYACNLFDYGIVIVGLNSDESIRRLKGKGRPIMSQNERAEILANLECVDLITIFDGDTPLDLIRQIKPDVICKGPDWLPDEVIGGREILANGGRIEIVPASLPNPTTSSIIRKMQRLK